MEIPDRQCNRRFVYFSNSAEQNNGLPYSFSLACSPCVVWVGTWNTMIGDLELDHRGHLWERALFLCFLLLEVGCNVGYVD